MNVSSPKSAGAPPAPQRRDEHRPSNHASSSPMKPTVPATGPTIVNGSNRDNSNSAHGTPSLAHHQFESSATIRQPRDPIASPSSAPAFGSLSGSSAPPNSPLQPRTPPAWRKNSPVYYSPTPSSMPMSSGGRMPTTLSSRPDLVFGSFHESSTEDTPPQPRPTLRRESPRPRRGNTSDHRVPYGRRASSGTGPAAFLNSPPISSMPGQEYFSNGLNEQVQLHDQLFQQYQMLEMQSNSLRAQLAAQQRAQQEQQAHIAHMRAQAVAPEQAHNGAPTNASGPPQTSPYVYGRSSPSLAGLGTPPNPLPQAYLYQYPESLHNPLASSPQNPPYIFDRTGPRTSKLGVPVNTSPKVSPTFRLPTFTIPPKKSKAIVIKNAEGEVVDFKKIDESLKVERDVEKMKNDPRGKHGWPNRFGADSGETAEPGAKGKAEAETKATDEADTEAKPMKEVKKKAREDASGPGATSFSALHIKQNVFPAESSRDDSSSTFRTSSARATESTAPTSVSGKEVLPKYFQKTQVAQYSIIEEEEPNEGSRQTEIPFDGQSTISADSVVGLTTQQRVDVVEKFSKALLRDLPIKCFASDNENVEMSTFHQSFSESVKIYAKKVMADAERRSRQRQASKAVRFLRNEIIHKCYETLGGFRHSERRHIPSIVHKLGQHDFSGKTAAEKVREWNAQLLDLLSDGPTDPSETESSLFLSQVNESDTEIPLVASLHLDDKPGSDVCNLSDTTEQSFSHISQLSQDEDGNISAEDRDVYTYLTEHSAFPELADELRALVERHFCNQRELIHHRILLAMRRPGITEQFLDGIFRASFYVDWNVLEFLQTCYSLTQDLRHVIAITGTPVNAQLTTVETYLQQNWPNHTWKLVNALNTAIATTIHGVDDEPPKIYPPQIQISLEEMKISVTGSEDLLVVIGQQLAWLGAACRDSAGQLAHCYTSFTDIQSTDPELPELKFGIKYEVTPLDSGERTSCWIDLVGDSVIVAGFPFAQRDSSAIGLEVPLQIMGAMANIPLVTMYRGGYVMKGRSMGFVPVKRGENFIQWHLYNHSTKRISYQEIKSLFPDRLLVKDLDEGGLSSARSFLGWCPESSNNLASGTYDYRTISYTKTPYLSKKVLSLTGASIGFQQFGTGSLSFAISKRHGMHRNEKAQYYKDLLDDAKQIPVVLQDMEDRRAWYADGERVILHIILHRHALSPFKANGPVQLASASPSDSASVRQAMMVYADTLVSLDKGMEIPGTRSKSFKDLVNELYTVLEGLMAETIDIASAGIELSLDWKKHIQGWEYMDVVNRKLKPRLRETELKSTCGQWPELARDRDAVVLFGNCLQNIISPHPHSPPRLCRLFKELPKHKDYLAIESEKLEHMYVESGAEDDRTQITLTGLQLHRSQHLFEICPQATARAERCNCKRIQQLVPKKAKGKVKPIPRMNATGAVIIGQGNTSWINDLCHNWPALRGGFQRHSVDSNSRGPNQVHSARGDSVMDFYLPRPNNPSTVSGSKSSSNSRSFSVNSAATKTTTATSDRSPTRSSSFAKVPASNSTYSPARTLEKINGMPSGEPSSWPNTSSESTTSPYTKARVPRRNDQPPQLRPVTGQPWQTPQCNNPVVAQADRRPYLPRQPVSKTHPENNQMDVPSMSIPLLRRKPNFPWENTINMAPPT